MPSKTGEQRDHHRVTEDGAEALALALVNIVRGWVVRRRLQRGEFADWLLQAPGDLLVALEVSGIDGTPDHRRLEEKLRQVKRAKVGDHQSACVVAFGPPAASLVTA